jgi:hypothetical protein
MANSSIKPISRYTSNSRPDSVRPSQRLQRALRKAWIRETSYDPSGWTTGNASWGQCAVTALVIQDHCGGSIMSGEVNGIPHYWNRLESNEELDLTHHQFGNPAPYSNAHPCDRDYILSYPDTVRRYQQLRRRVSSRLSTPSLVKAAS